MKYYTITEYFDEETGDPVTKEDVLTNYKIIKTIKTNVRHTAETTTTKRAVIVKRDAQLRIKFPECDKEGD